MSTNPLINSKSSKKELEERKLELHQKLSVICYEMLSIGVIRTINYLKTHHQGEQVVFFSDWDGMKCMIGTGNKSVAKGAKLLSVCWRDMPASVQLYFSNEELNVQFINNKETLRENVAKILFAEKAKTWLESDSAILEKVSLEKLTKPRKSNNPTAPRSLRKV